MQELERIIQYNGLRKDEESFFQQKSRIQWLNKGGRNIVYFFNKVKGHVARNKVMSIYSIEGQRIEGEEVHKEPIRFFSQTLGIAQRGGGDSVLNRLHQVIVRKLNAVQ